MRSVWLALLLGLVLSGCGVARPTATPRGPTATPGLAPAWAEIDAQHGALTGAQWDAYVAGLRGARVTALAGTVENVQEPIRGAGYTLYLAVPGVDHPYAYLWAVPATDAARYAKGQALTVSGAVQGVSCAVWCSVMLTDVTVLP